MIGNNSNADLATNADMGTLGKEVMLRIGEIRDLGDAISCREVRDLGGTRGLVLNPHPLPLLLLLLLLRLQHSSLRDVCRLK